MSHVLWCALLLSLPLSAGEPDSTLPPPDDAQQPTTAPAEAEDPLLEEAAAAAAEPQQNAPSGDDSFTPSIQISEDLSVSFPVDI